MEFTNIIPHENRNCKTILENLQKNRQLEILNMIKQNDSSTDFINKFEKKFTTYKINCADSSMNFNFMSLAVIYSNKKVYNNLKILCNSESLDIPDSANDFTAIYYDVLLQKNFFRDNKNNISFAKDTIYGTFHDNMCYVLTQYFGEVILNVIAPFTTAMIIRSAPTLFEANRIANFFQQHPAIAKCTTPSIIFLSFVAGRILTDHLPTKKYCQEYIDYQQINITKPNEFTTLKQVKKYTSINDDLYIVVDSECYKKKDTVTEIIQPVFKNPYVTNENIKFTVCKVTPSQLEKSSYTAFTTDHPQCVTMDYMQAESEEVLLSNKPATQESLTHSEPSTQESLAHSETSQANDYN